MKLILFSFLLIHQGLSREALNANITRVQNIKDKNSIEQNDEPIQINEQVFYYSNSKNVSLEVKTLEQRSKNYTLYDPFGNQTYMFEERYESFSIRVEVVEWHSNGAVAKVVVHTNPGASRYWYESTYTFGINNEPQWKYDLRFPIETTSFQNDNSYYWDIKTKQWKKQEVIYEQAVPRE